MQIDPNCAGLQPLWGENHPFLNFPWDLILQRIDPAPTLGRAVAFMATFRPFWIIRRNSPTALKYTSPEVRDQFYAASLVA